MKLSRLPLWWCFVGCFAGLSARSQASSTSGSVCGPVINFFPPGAEDDSLPPAWTQTAQEAAGNTNSSELYTIILTSNRNVPGIDATGPPVLQVLPQHDLFTVGKVPSRACMGYSAVATRHLMQADEDSSRDSSAARKLAQAEASGSVTVPARYRVQYSIGKNFSVDLGEFKVNGTKPVKIALNLTGVVDGYYCMTLKVTVVANTGMVGSVSVPAVSLYTTTQVCFYKLDAIPEANVTFNTCRSDAFSANITTPSIVPVPLFPGSKDLLFMPVFHFESDLNRTVDGSWPEGGAPEKMERWVVLDAAAAAGKPLIYEPEGQYPDGFYNIRMESSLATEYPSLLSLGVASGYDRYGGETVPEALSQMYKVLPNKQWPTGKLLGIQNEYTGFNSMDGPDNPPIPVNAELSFNWNFAGFGKQYCWIDGLRYYNDADQTCRQPLDLSLPNTKNHTLTIILVDVCGVNMTVEANYSTWGYTITTKPAPTKTQVGMDNDAVAGGVTFEFGSTNATVFNRPRTLSAAGPVGVGRLLSVPVLLAVTYVGWRMVGA